MQRRENERLELLVARRTSNRPKDVRHPFGYGREAYFWALLASVALFAFIRAVKAGQFDDLDTPAHRILHDDEDETVTKPSER